MCAALPDVEPAATTRAVRVFGTFLRVPRQQLLDSP